MKLRAYFVEDNATVRENLMDTLQELAAVQAVGTAPTEAEGVQWLSQNGAAWDIAIVDLFLREGSGMGLLRSCRARDHGQKMVVLSNYATPDIRRRCAQLGADAVFDKSTEIDALLDFCHKHLPQHRDGSPAVGALLQEDYDGVRSAGCVGRSRLGANAPAESRMG